ncbi:GGDEF domain-containing protein [Massilia aurea]|jgi:diguanylate cyclase (GGDEF)-like protein|uniref:GGDEF domain-containing protein n=1 Tax=Massilia aurea TaxID=373040 RepID=UPI002162546C|nr:GGDEF domain-containing protein [Massilia aurea]MCS0706449.1 GGDEF domain-containing protein [Massilia aurea]
MSKLQSPGDIRCWHSEFASVTIESKFLHDHGNVIQGESVRSLAFCGIFFCAFGLADLAQLGYGDQALALFLARLMVMIAALIGIVMIRRSSNPARTAYRVATVFTSLAMLTFLLVAYFRGDLLLHGMSMAIMLIIVYLFIPNRLVNATIVALSASIAFLGLVYAVDMISVRQLSTMTMLLILANLFGAIAARRDSHSSRRQYWTRQILISQAMRDPLTGVFNRRHLNAGLLDEEIDRARVNGESLTVIICDIDGFKAVNDTHGHQAGDTLLRDFAHLLLSMTRDGIDTVVRYGGEEFLLILPDTDLPDGLALAERIRTKLTEAISMHGDVRINATASFGVVSTCLLPHLPTIASHALIARADELMYAAKRSGRNRVHVAEWNVTSSI